MMTTKHTKAHITVFLPRQSHQPTQTEESEEGAEEEEWTDPTEQSPGDVKPTGSC